MRISTGHGRSYHIAFFIILARPRIDDCPTIGPRAQGMLAVGIGQRIVAGVWQAIFTLSGSTAIDKHILILNLADRRCLKEAEYTFLPIARNHVLHHFGTGLYRAHGSRVQLRAMRNAKSPITIHASIIVNKHCGVESQATESLTRTFLVPIAYCKRTIGTVAFGNHGIAPATLIIRKEVISFLTIGIGSYCHVRSKKHVVGSISIQFIQLGRLIDFKYHAVISPTGQVLYGCRPHHLVTSAIHPLEIVVRTINIDTVLAGTVRILKHIGLTIRNKFPKRQIRILCR